MDNYLYYLIKKIHMPFKLILLSVFLSIINSLFKLAIPILIGRIINTISTDQLIYSEILILISLIIITTLMTAFNFYLFNKISEIVIFSIRYLIVRRVIFMDINFFNKNSSGELISRITEDTLIINDFVSQKLPNVVPSFITLIGAIIILFYIDWKTMIIIIIIIPIILIVLVPIGNIIESISYQTQNEMSIFTSNLNIIFQRISLIKSQTTENNELKKLHNNLDNLYKYGLKESKILSILQPIISLLSLIIVSLLIIISSIRISNGDMTFSNLIIIILVLFQLISPSLNIISLVTDYKKSLGASKKLVDLIKNPIENITSKNSNKIKHGSLRLSNVSFSYDNQKEILKNINIDFGSNGIIAIIGPSGSGKSTLLNILNRFYSIDKGEITLGNKNIYNYSLYEWRNFIAYVMQTNLVMPISIKENILYGNNTSDFKKYAKEAYIDSFSKSFNTSYDTLLGEKGEPLSGGQQQRLSIARAFAKEASIILLDEATSNLDTISEYKIQKSIEKKSKDTLIIIVAHRLSTILNADKIYFLKNGTVTGEGTHDFLIKNHLDYQKFMKNNFNKSF